VPLACDRSTVRIERADEDPVSERGAGDVRAPALVDDGRFRHAAESLDHRQDSLGPRLDRPHEGGAEGVEDGDLEIVDQAARQIGELGLRDELG